MTTVSLLRTRWSALGAAVAISLGAAGIGTVSATVNSGDRLVLVPITPCRIVDTRPDFQVGPKTSPLGPVEVLTVSAHGDNGECTGIPNDAAALSLNVTAVDATLATFLTIWANGQPRPNSSSLNPSPGEPPTPNAVTTELSPTGQFDVYNKQGSVHVFVDVNGYYVHHDHEDRYYRKIEAVLAFEAIHPTTISVSPTAMHPTEEGTEWGLQSYDWWHSATSSADECIVGAVELRPGRHVTEISLVYFVPFGNPYVYVGVFGVRDTPGDTAIIDIVADGGLTAPLTPNAAYERLDVPLLADTVVLDDRQHSVIICTSGVISVVGVHVTSS